MYERLRFDRVRKCQRNGEDIRDRWHGALKKLDAGESLNPEDVMMRVRSRFIGIKRCNSPNIMQNRWLYPFDAEADTLERWNEVATVVEKELRDGKITPLFEKTANGSV